MRDIKFRAWDKVCKKMAMAGSVRFDAGGVEQAYLEYYSTPMNDYRWMPADAIELMQFTGRKDKKGKEIFEGDLVIDREKSNAGYIFQVISNGTYFEIVSDQDVGKKVGGAILGRRGIPFWPTLEILGNIYENPELLKGEKVV